MSGQHDVTKQWWRRFDADTGNLRQGEYGCYRLLINYYFEFGELPPAREQLYIIARAATLEEKGVCDLVLHKKFKLADGRWSSQVVEHALATQNIQRNKYDLRSAAALDKSERVRVRGEAKTGNKGRPPGPMSLILSDIDPAKFEVPAWIPMELWRSWLAIRKEIGEINSARSLQMRVRELTALRNKGQQPGYMLQQAITKRWGSFRQFVPSADRSV